MQTPSLLWITDPWSTLYHFKDTTLRLMHEAINMGIPTFWSASDFIFNSKNSGEIMAVEVKQLSDLKDLSAIAPKSYPLSTFQQIHDRVDPPVDAAYCGLIDRLLEMGTPPHCILNPPDLIKHQSEKIPPPSLMQFAPKLQVIHQPSDVAPTMELFKNDAVIVTKPMNLAQSIGIEKHTTPRDQNEWMQLAKKLTMNFSSPILVEEYLSEIEQGEVRLWFAGEVLIGTLKKFPKQGDFRVLIDQGSPVTAYTLTTQEQSIADAIGKTIREQGVLMAAVDLIGNKICDYNITSPGLLVQLEEVNGRKNLARMILNQALQYRAPGARE